METHLDHFLGDNGRVAKGGIEAVAEFLDADALRRDEISFERERERGAYPILSKCTSWRVPSRLETHTWRERLVQSLNFKCTFGGQGGEKAGTRLIVWGWVAWRLLAGQRVKFKRAPG